MTKTDQLKQLFIDCNLEKEDVFKSPQGFTIITRTGIEKIQYAKNIVVEYECLKLDYESKDKFFVVVRAVAHKDSQRIETFGEACPANCRQSYPVAMAEKRALSRAVLKMAGFYQLGVFGEDESEDFKKG